MSTLPSPEAVSQPDHQETSKKVRDPKMLVQVHVMRGLGLGENESLIMDRYVSEMYAEKCREIMLTDPEVISALNVEVGKEGDAKIELSAATALLIEKLHAWKNEEEEKNQRLAA